MSMPTSGAGASRGRKGSMVNRAGCKKHKAQKGNLRAGKRTNVKERPVEKDEDVFSDEDGVIDEDYDDDDDEGEGDEEDVEEEGKGVNKIKSSIRQTKRLLAKDKLSALSRQDGERRLIALEDELTRREAAQKERKNAQRSHKIRFFERQKLMRKIGKLQRRLQGEETLLSDKEKKLIEDDLTENRVLLNYVLHYPLTQKYVSLFPNGGPSPLDKEGAADTEESSESRRRMQDVRRKIVEAMKKGELSGEPDVELRERIAQRKEDKAEGMPTSTPGPKRKQLSSTLETTTVKSKKQKSQSKGGHKETSAVNALADDDFFA